MTPFCPNIFIYFKRLDKFGKIKLNFHANSSQILSVFSLYFTQKGLFCGTEVAFSIFEPTGMRVLLSFVN